MLKLINIVKDYPTATTTVHALRGVSLAFRENEFVSILGPSGCGKTTMLNIIGGLDRYTSGDLVIGGVSTASFDDSHWDAYRNATIGFVFQSYNLIPHLTVLENVELALKLIGEKKKTRRMKAIEALAKVGMDGEINKRPNQLSGGQMQRVAIARAIVNDPKIILADEPTGALDSELSISVMNILQEIAQNRLVIMVTHNGELAKQYSTRICRFKDGQLIEDTNPYVEEEVKAEEAKQTSESGAESELVTTDTVTLAENEAGAESVSETAEAAEEAEAAKESNPPTSAETAGQLNPADLVDYSEFAEGTEPPKKKLSNHRRKKQLKRMSADKNEVFGKLGLSIQSRREKKAAKKNKTFKPTSMSIGTAFSLSLKNLISKRRRTFLTSFAGSIGIIGLGLVLSISNGFNVFVKDMQTEMLAGVPLGIYEYNVQASAVMDIMSNMSSSQGNKPTYPDSDELTVQTKPSGSDPISNILGSFFKSVSKNDLTEEFAQYMLEMPQDYYSALSVYYGLQYNLIAECVNEVGVTEYKDVSQKPSVTQVMGIAMTVLGESGMQPDHWQVMVDKENMLKNYDLLGNSRYPENKYELLLCVDENNGIDASLLKEFGLYYYIDEVSNDVMPITNVSADFFIGKKLKLLYNNDYYASYISGGNPVFSAPEAEDCESLYGQKGVELTITGVIRSKKGATNKFVSNALCYTPELAQDVLDNSYESDIAKAQRDEFEKNPDSTRAVLLGVGKVEDDDFTSSTQIGDILTKSLTRTSYLKRIGATKAPSYITIYPGDFDQKANASKYVTDWNAKNKGSVGFFDVSEMFIYNLTMIIDLVSIMLVAVASISLVVSTVMIGVITSNSVIERTREIGILRSLGARKKDIRSVFIAETSLLGLAGGLIGIVLTYILCPIISAIIGVASGVGNLLHFHPLHALLLVVLSLLLTVISGILPAISASRKNVVDALKVE